MTESNTTKNRRRKTKNKLSRKKNGVRNTIMWDIGWHTIDDLINGKDSFPLKALWNITMKKKSQGISTK